jgi:hypothetical protein
VLEQRRELARIRAEHDGDGMAGQLDGTTDDGMHERAAVHADELLGRTETRRSARCQNHDVDVACVGARVVHGL